MKKIITSVTFLFFVLGIRAQLAVNYGNQVGIGTETEFFDPILMVGDHSFYDGNGYNIGIAGSPETMNKNNIGVEGIVHDPNTIYNTLDMNYGVLGIVNNMNSTHGRNYGVCGMIDNPGVGNFYGGAGVYGTCFVYFYENPNNLQGAYAGFFAWDVHVSNNLTATSMYSTCDSRLCDHIVPLDERDRNGRRTLDNLLCMKIVEYNLKSKLDNRFGDIAAEKGEEQRTESEFLKKEDQEMTSRHHFGIDAQELQKIYPDLVLESKDGYLSVNYMEMVPLVVRSIQELKMEMDEMKEIEDE